MAERCQRCNALVRLLERLERINDLGLADWPPLADVHPAARRLLAGWGYRYDAWSLRRFQPPKRYAVLLCSSKQPLAETAVAVVEAQDKRRTVEVLEVMGELVLDDSIPDLQLRSEILWRIPNER